MSKLLRPLAILDTETTGLDHTRNEIIDVAVLRVDPVTLTVEREYAARVRPAHPERLTPDAHAVNGFDAARWDGAIGIGAAMHDVHELTRGCVLAGHNIDFDLGFVNGACRRAALGDLEVHHHRVDTGTLAWPLLQAGAVESLRLDAICAHLGIEIAGAHTARGDVHRTLAVLRALLQRFAGWRPPLTLVHGARA
ncbi:3'-5' exonuclease [Sandaracinus amylolyticus]|uniref:Exonuclease domain-containing protein n=1 Tax=Sandaracinus amylolyticus TaxID=927083 RepID=A0A0F6YIS4_9BACT|nr:3'-5' exonuclease [Sandaracinus amylolyticus]AKF06103.1 hypothetical protein DB32_003252 [Sandaracinus amylolyticus]